jgi:hypothetical protein
MRLLKMLILAGNGLRDKGLKMMVSSFHGADEAPGLLVFDLSNNPIGSGSADELSDFLSKRRDVLLLGTAGTMMCGMRRRRLLQQSMSNFTSASPEAALEAWRLGANGNFADSELCACVESSVEDAHQEHFSIAEVLDSCPEDRVFGGDRLLPRQVSPEVSPRVSSRPLSAKAPSRPVSAKAQMPRPLSARASSRPLSAKGPSRPSSAVSSQHSVAVMTQPCGCTQCLRNPLF